MPSRMLRMSPERMQHQLVSVANAYEFVPDATSSGARAARRAHRDAVRLDSLSATASLYHNPHVHPGHSSGLLRGHSRGQQSASFPSLGEPMTYYLSDLPLEPTQLPELRSASAVLAHDYDGSRELQSRDSHGRTKQYPRSPHSAAGTELREIASQERLHLASHGLLSVGGGMGSQPIGRFLPPRRDSPHSGGRAHSTHSMKLAHSIDLADQGLSGSGSLRAPRQAKAASAARNRDQAGTVLGFSTLHMKTLEFETERRRLVQKAAATRNRLEAIRRRGGPIVAMDPANGRLAFFGEAPGVPNMPPAPKVSPPDRIWRVTPTLRPHSARIERTLARLNAVSLFDAVSALDLTNQVCVRALRACLCVLARARGYVRAAGDASATRAPRICRGDAIWPALTAARSVARPTADWLASSPHLPPRA